MNGDATTVILHLSDMHFGDAKTQKKKNAKKLVLSSLLTAISKISDDWKPNVVCITGDIANWGLEKEYDEARKWIEDLLSRLDLAAEALFLCPGNHDIDRSKATIPRPKTAKESDDLFSVPISKTDPLHIPFGDYENFCDNLGTPKYSCGEEESHLIGVKHFRGICFLAVNSAWFSRGDDDQNELWLGIDLLKSLEAHGQIKNPEDSNEFPLTVSLMHHPFDWLHDGETNVRFPRLRSAEYLAHRTNLLLTGHNHDRLPPHQLLHERCWHLPVGAAYADDRHLNSFRLIKITPPHSWTFASYEYDPGSPDRSWKECVDTQPRPLRPNPQMWSQVIELEPLRTVTPQNLFVEPALTNISTGSQTAELTIDENAHAEFDEELKQVSKLIKMGRQQDALRISIALFDRAKANGAPDNFLASVANNEGVCLLDIGQPVAATNKFRQALSLKEDSVPLMCNLVQALIDSNQISEAETFVGKLLEIAPTEDSVIRVHSRLLHQLNNLQDLETLYTRVQEGPGTPQKNSLLSEIAFDLGRYEVAASLLKLLIPDDPEDLASLELLSRCLILNVQAAVRKEPALAQNLSVELREQAEEGKALITKILTIADRDQCDNQRLLSALHINRAAAELILEQWSEAIIDYEKVLTISPADVVAARGRVFAFIASGRFEDASREIDLHEPVLRIALGQALLDSQRTEEALKVVEGLPEDVNLSLLVDGTRVRTKALIRLGRREAALTIASELASRFSENSNALWLQAEIEYDCGNQESAVSLMEEALTNSTEFSRANIALNLGNLYFALSRFDDAIRAYTSTNDSNSEITEKLIVALFYAGHELKALDAIRERDRLQQRTRAILETLQQIYEAMGDVEAELDVAKELASLEPAHIGYKLVTARCLSKLGRDRDAIELLQSADKGKAALDSSVGLPLAYALRCHDQFDESIQLAFLTRRINFDKPDVHNAYISLFLCLPAVHKARTTPERVEIGNIVFFRQDGQEHHIFISDEESPDLAKGEIHPESTLAKLLIGARVNDEIIVNEHGFGTSTATIASIVTKYAFALTETLSKFNTWFPDRIDIRRFDISQMKDIAELAAASQPRHSQPFGPQGSELVSLSMLARNLGQNVPSLWAKLVEAPHTRLYTDSGLLLDVTQRRREHQPETVVLDTSAVLTLVYLGQTEVFESSFARKIVPSTVLVELHEALEAEKISANSQQSSPAPLRYSVLPFDYSTLLEKAKAFVLSQELQTDERILSKPGKDSSKVCGRSAYLASLIAKTLNGVVYSDDFAVRNWIQATSQLRGMSSQDLLHRLAGQQRISSDTFTLNLAKLLRAGYWFVSPTNDDFYRAFQAERDTPSAEFLDLTESFFAAEPWSAARVINNFMGQALFSGVSLDTSEKFFFACLDGFLATDNPVLAGRALHAVMLEQFGSRSMFRELMVLSMARWQPNRLLDAKTLLVNSVFETFFYRCKNLLRQPLPSKRLKLARAETIAIANATLPYKLASGNPLALDRQKKRPKRKQRKFTR
jgi:tetratricopeptide (TPR) repeat protein